MWVKWNNKPLEHTTKPRHKQNIGHNLKLQKASWYLGLRGELKEVCCRWPLVRRFGNEGSLFSMTTREAIWQWRKSIFNDHSWGDFAMKEVYCQWPLVRWFGNEGSLLSMTTREAIWQWRKSIVNAHSWGDLAMKEVYFQCHSWGDLAFSMTTHGAIWQWRSLLPMTTREAIWQWRKSIFNDHSWGELAMKGVYFQWPLVNRFSNEEVNCHWPLVRRYGNEDVHCQWPLVRRFGKKRSLLPMTTRETIWQWRRLLSMTTREAIWQIFSSLVKTITELPPSWHKWLFTNGYYCAVLCCAQMIEYIMAQRSYSFVCTLHYLIIIIMQTCLKLLKYLSATFFRACVKDYIYSLNHLSCNISMA